MNALRKAMATLITAITLAGSADAGDRLPVELLGCWKWHGSDGPRLSNAVYHRNQVSAENCKGSDNMLIFSDRYGMNNGDGEIDCRLRSVISEKRGQYQFRFQCGDEPIFTSTMMLKGDELTVRETP